MTSGLPVDADGLLLTANLAAEALAILCLMTWMNIIDYLTDCRGLLPNADAELQADLHIAFSQ